MSTTPMFSNKNGEDPFGPAVRDRYTGGGLVEQGISAELIAARWGLSREVMDSYSVQSHQRAAAAQIERFTIHPGALASRVYRRSDCDCGTIP